MVKVLHYNTTGEKGTQVYKIKGLERIEERICQKQIGIGLSIWFYDLLIRIKKIILIIRRHITENGMGYKDNFEDGIIMMSKN